MTFTEGNPTFMELIETAFDEYFRRFAGPMLAEVKTYNALQQTADVQPIVKIYFQDHLVSMPIIRSVPIQWPGGSDGALTFNLASGDIVGIIPQGVDISNWVASGTINQAAATARKLSLSDVVAIPRFRSIANPLPPTAYSVLGPVLSGPTVFLGDSTATEFVALANLVLNELTAIKTWADTHVHSGVTPGPSPTGSPTVPMPVPGSVEATKVKAK